MSNKKDIFAIVPVKGSSERVKKKNLRAFADTTLLELKISQLKMVSGLDCIIVSSESEEVLDIAKAMGVETHVRDPKYSTPDIPMSAVYSFIASEVKGEHLVWAQVTSPLADQEVYERAIDLYFSQVNGSKQHDSLLSVFEVKDYIFQDGKPIGFKPNPWMRSQDLKGLCAMSFTVNILKREDMIRWGSCVGEKPYFFYIDKMQGTDIDYQEDFDFCEMLYKQKQKEEMLIER